MLRKSSLCTGDWEAVNALRETELFQALPVHEAEVKIQPKHASRHFDAVSSTCDALPETSWAPQNRSKYPVGKAKNTHREREREWEPVRKWERERKSSKPSLSHKQNNSSTVRYFISVLTTKKTPKPPKKNNNKWKWIHWNRSTINEKQKPKKLKPKQNLIFSSWLLSDFGFLHLWLALINLFLAANCSKTKVTRSPVSLLWFLVEFLLQKTWITLK